MVSDGQQPNRCNEISFDDSGNLQTLRDNIVSFLASEMAGALGKLITRDIQIHGTEYT
jgi:hypothetical protein